MARKLWELAALPTALLALCVTGCSSSSGGSANNSSASAAAGQCTSLPPLAKKSSYTVGFANFYETAPAPWRDANNQSIMSEGANRGDTMVFQQPTAASDVGAEEVQQFQALINQKVDVIFTSAETTDLLEPLIVKAREACIPVFVEDRGVDTTAAIPGKDYVTYIGSDFTGEGTKVANWLLANKPAGDTMNILEIEGTTGSAAASGRKQGFDSAVAGQAGITIMASQTGNFQQQGGHDTMAALLPQYPNVNVVFSHNDMMSLGVIQAITEAGKVPGKDIYILSIDGTQQGVQDIINGQIAVIVQCNPYFGPVLFDNLANYAAGQTLPTSQLNVDQVFDSTNAAQYLSQAF